MPIYATTTKMLQIYGWIFIKAFEIAIFEKIYVESYSRVGLDVHIFGSDLGRVY